MALGNITFYSEGPFGNPGTKRYTVAAGAVATINPGEPVSKALGAAVVTPMATNKPVVATDFLAGISQSTSTDTVALAGTVDVYDVFAEGMTFLVAPNVAATWNTQAKYNALVGFRVLLDLTGGVYTILAADGVTNGCVVEPLDIAKYPGVVRFAIRQGVNFLS